MVVRGAAPVDRLAGRRCAARRPRRTRTASAASGRQWSARCPRRGGAAPRGSPGRTGSRRAARAARRPRRAGGWRAAPAAPGADRVRGAQCSDSSPAPALPRRVRDRVHHDVREVVVDEAVDDLPAVPLAAHHPGRLQHPQVLADQRLGHADARRRARARSGRCSRSSRTIAMRTGAASARSRSPAAARVADRTRLARAPRRPARGSAPRRAPGRDCCRTRRPAPHRIPSVDIAAPHPSAVPPWYAADAPSRPIAPRPLATLEASGRVHPWQELPTRDQQVQHGKIDTIVALSKRRGFVFPSGEIYGGTRSAWDYGPLGVELKENIKRQWWKAMVHGRDDVVGLDSSVILPRQVWVASGHVEAFVDPLVECTDCHHRYRRRPARRGVRPAHRQGGARRRTCPTCRARTAAPAAPTPSRSMFNGLLKTFLGPVETEEGLHYLRPETAQGIFVNFLNVLTTSRRRPPFGIAQIGKSFRNEITPGQLHLPHPRVRADGDGVLRRARHRRGVAPVLDRHPHRLVHRPRHRRRRTCGSTSIPRRSSRTTPSAPSTSSTASGSAGRSGASWRASPTAPTSTSRRTRTTPAPT